jgi:hypothetical protein
MMRSWKRDYFSSGREPTRLLDRGLDKFERRVEIIQDRTARREGSHIEE